MNWTEGRIRAFIVSVLRAGARRWPPKFETLAAAFIGKNLMRKLGERVSIMNATLAKVISHPRKYR